VGKVEFAVNLATVSVAEANRQALNPNLRHLTVEAALKAVADDYGIALPDAFLTVTKSFRPKLPAKK
jgi:hypothetical protein